ncbi:FAD-dependent monooxygenase [Kitasatospora sp. NPDC094011]|uniref:FAD-dependent monooxygenase n=1 Tax=Kitasatospora sp. NPDC094011 TaxID=3364090 RepID=UPI00380FAFB7
MDADVIIVGAGPAGLMLAGELRLGGARVVVLERLARPSGESRGLGFNARTMEVFEQRGLLPRFGEVSTTAQGHFGGVPVDFGLLEGAHYGVKGIPQFRIEQVLSDWAVELGARIRRGQEVVGLADRGEHVEVTVRGPAVTSTLRARYLVGCDGGRSVVRRAAGFDFPGTDATRELLMADLRDGAITPRPIGETVPGGMVMSAPLGEGVDRIVVSELDAPPAPRDRPVGFAEVAAGWQRLTGQDVSAADPVWASSFTDAARQVTEYRRGRVLLAGDAAHIHLPAGGQGLNVSTQDAVNLGWKLAATVRGRAPAGLLDSYHAERHPVGRRLLGNTRAQGLLFLTGDRMRPFQQVLAELVGYPAVARHLIGMVSGLDIRYPSGDDDHPLLGRRLPTDRRLVRRDGRATTTGELLHRARGVLLDLTGGSPAVDAATPWRDRVDVVAVESDPESAGGAGALLIRPDGHVAWADTAALELTTALERWFGKGLPCV